jgi:hypothetical protein
LRVFCRRSRNAASHGMPNCLPTYPLRYVCICNAVLVGLCNNSTCGFAACQLLACVINSLSWWIEQQIEYEKEEVALPRVGSAEAAVSSCQRGTGGYIRKRLHVSRGMQEGKRNIHVMGVKRLWVILSLPLISCCQSIVPPMTTIPAGYIMQAALSPCSN